MVCLHLPPLSLESSSGLSVTGLSGFTEASVELALRSLSVTWCTYMVHAPLALTLCN